MLKSRSLITAMIIFLCLFITATPRMFADDTLQGPENGSYLLRIFEGKYLDLSERVSRGELPADVLTKANRIRAHLKKTVIKYNAEMELLKVDILDGTREEGKSALEHMIVLVNETEQNKVHYLQKLSKLIPSGSTEEAAAVMPSKEVPSADYFETGAPKQVVTVIKTVEARPKADKDKPKARKEDIWQTKDFDLRMQLEPADNTQGDIE